MLIKRLFLMGLCLTVMTIGFSCKKDTGDKIKIGAIFSITGGASNLGAPEAKTLEMLVEQINADHVKLFFRKGSPSHTLAEVRRFFGMPSLATNEFGLRGVWERPKP